VPTPYEELLHAAIVGDATLFTREDVVEETWRVLEPLLDLPSAPEPYAMGSWGPTAADELAADVGGWRAPWT
jgi:glucose-6-phosphate 1-dehydrogenase